MSAILDSLRKATPRYQDLTDREEQVSNEIAERLTRQHADNVSRVQRAASVDVRLANDKQKGLVRYLLSQLRTHNAKVYADAAPWVERNLETLTFSSVSNIIDRLRAHLAAPGVAGPTVEAPAKRAYDPYDDIPSGYYAVSNNDGDTSFYRVNHKDGRVYVDLQVSDALHRIPWATRKAALDKIRTDGPEACGKRYADEIGRCYRCGRTLTDETSRELGIGPTCRNK